MGGPSINPAGLVVSSSKPNIPITLGDSSSLDAFGRLRVGTPFGIFENKNVFGRNLNQWEEDTNGAGASISTLAVESSVELAVGTVDGGYAIRQTHRYFAYVPGKSQSVVMTGVLGAGKANVIRRIGYFDDNDGLFFELNGTTLNVVVRNAGSPTVIPQSSWEVNGIKDPYDGSGPSGITIDPSKAQIFMIDFQWLGAGRVRFCVDIDGMTVPVHEVLNANNITAVYMSTPSLPLRYEIRNDGTAASSSTLKEICSSVISEGGYALPGFEFSTGLGATLRGSVTTTRTPILAIRLADAHQSKENRKTARFLRANYFSSGDAYFEVAHLHAPSALTGTFGAIGGGSAVEVSTDITAITGNPEHIIGSSYLASGVGGSGGNLELTSEFINLHSYISQNMASDNSQMFVIYARALSGTISAGAAIDEIEFD